MPAGTVGFSKTALGTQVIYKLFFIRVQSIRLDLESQQSEKPVSEQCYCQEAHVVLHMDLANVFIPYKMKDCTMKIFKPEFLV